MTQRNLKRSLAYVWICSLTFQYGFSISALNSLYDALNCDSHHDAGNAVLPACFLMTVSAATSHHSSLILMLKVGKALRSPQLDIHDRRSPRQSRRGQYSRCKRQEKRVYSGRNCCRKWSSNHEPGSEFLASGCWAVSGHLLSVLRSITADTSISLVQSLEWVVA